MAKIIIVNSGSASVKYALFDNQDQIAFYNYEKNGEKFSLNEIISDNVSRVTSIPQEVYKKSFDHFIDDIKEHKFITAYSDIKAVVFRVVAPGKYFQEDRVIDERFMQKIVEYKKKSPIHLNHLQNEINSVRNKLINIKMIAISDSAFFKDKPIWNSIYSLPHDFMEKYEIYRYGYHGISVESVLEKVKNKIPLPEKIIVCHLGGGSSVSAIKSGKPVDNSMGYSPVSGIPMSTRIGDIDTEALLSVYESEKLTMDELHELIYKKSGLLGVSGISDDTRLILDEYEHNENARTAVNFYISSIKKYIGAYYSILNGLDLLIFTGTIGIRSKQIREMICENMDTLGINLDKNLNIKNYPDDYLNEPGSSALIMQFETNEMEMMAKKSIKFLDEIGA